MTKALVKFDDYHSIPSFVWKVSEYPFDIDLVSGRYYIDAKSVMGIFGLDLSKEIKMVMHEDGPICEELLNELKKIDKVNIKEYK